MEIDKNTIEGTYLSIKSYIKINRNLIGGGGIMSKLENNLSRFFGDCGFNFNGGILIAIVLVFLLLCTDILDDFFDDDSIWIWIILIILLLFNFDDGCCC